MMIDNGFYVPCKDTKKNNNNCYRQTTDNSKG